MYKWDLNRIIKNKVNYKLKPLYTSNKRYIVLYGGRGSGKSYAVADRIIYNALAEKCIILCTKQFQASIRDSVYSLLKQRIEDLGVSDYFTYTDNEIRAVTGSKIIFKGLQDPENTIKSISNIKYCWIEEAQILKESTFNILTPSIRANDSKIYITFNPLREDDIVYKEFVLKDNELASVININYYDNPNFPDVLRLEMEKDRRENLLKYEYVWEGKIQKVDPNALWKQSFIKYITEEDKTKYENFANLSRIVVAIDPSTTSKESSDACGLVVAGKVVNENKYVVLEDCTMISSPYTWATKAIDLYHKYNADRVVAEVNQGGDMVETIIKSIDSNIPYKGVYASRGKITRAEPIAVLYENEKVLHFNILPELEKEMLTYIGNGKSPNRLDALVWALTELSGKSSVKVLSGSVKSTFTAGIKTKF